MKCQAFTVGKYALLACNFIFLLSGFGLIALGIILAHDTPRLLLSILALNPSTHVQPFLYYVSLGLILVGMLICVASAVGCWAGCVPHTCILALFIFLLVILLLGEISFAVVASLCPQLLGVDMDRDNLVENLQRNYGLPAKEKYTTAVDLAQTLFECCGMSSGGDYDNAFWRDREMETKRNLRVPRSCCLLSNTNDANAFLDPKPMNDTLCQAKTNADYQRGRHTKGCIENLNHWFQEHFAIFLTTSLSLIVVQLSVLLTSIFVCVKRSKKSLGTDTPTEYPDTPNRAPRNIFELNTVRNDEIYPIKTLPSSGTTPLVLLNANSSQRARNNQNIFRHGT